MNKTDFDVVIVGGGMVGATLACALGDSDMRVAVVDKQEPAAIDDREYDLRVSAITLGSKAIFESVGTWDAMRAQRISCIDAMTVWDEGGSGRIHFDSAEMAQPCLGYIVENRVILQAALERMRNLRNADFYRPVAIEEMQVARERVQLKLGDGTVLTTALVVGADGAMSMVRHWAGIASRSWSWDQKAIVATVRTSAPHLAVARQRFFATGPLAFLPLDHPNTCSIVWSADIARADELLAMTDEDFIVALQTAIADGPGNDLGEVIEVSKRAAFPLTAIHANDYVAERMVLVGDAAHRIHPLAGQGLNLGLGDIAALAEVLIDARREKKDIGSRRVLRRYERWRRGSNELMLATMDGFKRLFGNDDPIVSGLRNVGLDIADGLTPVKYRIMRYAAGLTGDLPKLARGRRP